MTHWVIRKNNGQIYAGADKLASAPDRSSELSGSGFMDGVHDTQTVKKLVKYTSDNFSVVICCAGKTYPQHKYTMEHKNIINVLDDILNHLNTNGNLRNISGTSSEILQQLMTLIKNDLKEAYSVDNNKNSLLLGFGLCSNGQASIGYYNSIADEICQIDGNYLNLKLEQNENNYFVPGGGSMLGLDPFTFAVEQEIYTIAPGSNNRVSKDCDTIGISAPTPQNISDSHYTYTGLVEEPPKM